MGGNAFENLIRLNKDEYNEYAKDISDYLSKWFINKKTISYEEKESFGDLDLIIESDDFDYDMEFIKGRMERDCRKAEFKRNGSVLSFKYKDFQTDLIFVSPENFDCAHFYYSYNDLNNFVGRIAHKLGVKFGWDGLNHSLKGESGHNEIRTNLTKDPELIYNYLDYDYKRYKKGFKNLNEIFEFITSSKYFNKEIYAYENMDHRNRTRNRKRPNYELFLKWIKENDEKLGNGYHFESNKQNYLMKMDQNFPEVDIFGVMKEHSSKIRKIAKRKKVFNANKIMEWTGIKQGKEVGLLIKGLKDFCNNVMGMSLELMIDSCECEDEIGNIFMMYYEFGGGKDVCEGKL